MPAGFITPLTDVDVFVKKWVAVHFSSPSFLINCAVNFVVEISAKMSGLAAVI